MESGHVSRTDPDKNHQAPNDTATPVSPTPSEEQHHDGSSPLPTSDRIRSHVFAIRSTETPTSCSFSSNESLFSIQSGNTSLGKEQMSLMFRSSEFPGYNCDSMNISSPLLELPSSIQFTDFATKSGNFDEGVGVGVGEFGVTEPAAAEAMTEVFTEQECQQKDDTPVEFSHHSRSISMHSDASVKSFAFPVLEGEGDNRVSLKKSTKNRKEQSRPSTSLEENPDISQENSKAEESQLIVKTQTQKSTKNAGLKKWFSCFFCRPSSS